ncbi:MAG: DUF2179 domain-containing protein [Vallitalea sp.]|nr:DUF2179 domain-containing protein [Vallitalea sp.]
MKTIIFILILQLLYVPILTMRTIFMVKGKSIIASSFGFLEAAIYIFGLSLVLNDDQTFLTMLIYALGFGFGIFIGNFIEQKLAIGYTTFTIGLKNRNNQLIHALRNNGYGVTVFEGEGVNGKRYNLDILIDRHEEQELLKLVESYEPNCFIISYEPRKFKKRSSLLFK